MLEWYIGAQNEFRMEEKVIEEPCPYNQTRSVLKFFDGEVSAMYSGDALSVRIIAIKLWLTSRVRVPCHAFSFRCLLLVQSFATTLPQYISFSMAQVHPNFIDISGTGFEQNHSVLLKVQIQLDDSN
jgi:hypothetical protein